MIGIKSASQIPISNTHFLRNILTKSRSCNGPQYMNLALILENLPKRKKNMQKYGISDKSTSSYSEAREIWKKIGILRITELGNTLKII